MSTRYLPTLGEPGKGNGKQVQCFGTSPKSHQEFENVSRERCLMKPYSTCYGCPDENFEIFFQIGIGNQIVSCPRWEDNTYYLDKGKPTYTSIRREICLTKKPFNYCSSCPNSDPSSLPKSEDDWWDWDNLWSLRYGKE